MADVKSLEHPTLKVPYEVLNKKFRSAQKNIDREIAHVQTAASDLEKFIHGRSVTVGDVTTALDSVVEKLSILKRKADESIQDELDAAKTCKRRVEHLKAADGAQGGAVSIWKKKRLDRMLVEYFLRAGYYNSALKLAEHSELVDLTNIDLFLTCKEVEESLIRNETAACLNWCHDNKSKLRKMKSTLEFNLRQQEYIELVRSNRRLEAVRHARKYFTSAEDDQVKDIQKVMGLLAFPVDTQIIPYRNLLDPCRWQDLVEQFREDNYKLHQLNSMSILTVTLQAGLSALKTPHCYKEKGDHRNPDCPVCTKNLNELAEPLPYAHCSNSRLICSISGLPLNEHNPPLMLPNGNVYGLSALASMAAENEGRVVCPRTKSIFNLEEADKVFVM